MKYLLMIVFPLLSIPVQAATPVTGRWLTAEKESIIEIGTCGSSVCGKVLRVLKTMPDGKPALDRFNPDLALRGRRIEGMMILTGFTDGGALWNGRIYDPKSGKSYKSKLSRNGDGTLTVQGCIAFFCQSFKWTPAK